MPIYASTMRYRGIVLLLAMSSAFAGAETLPRGVVLPKTREPLTVPQVIEKDLIYAEGYSSTPVYRNGANRAILKPSIGKWSLVYETAGLRFNGDDAVALKVQRSFNKGANRAWREGIIGRVGEIDIGVTFDLHPQSSDWTFVSYQILNTNLLRYITSDAHDRLNERCKTELAAADFLYGLKRADVVGSKWPQSAENMAWLLVGSLSLVGASDNLTRYEVGDLVYYVSVRPADRRQKKSPTIMRGHAFDRRTGEWLGEVTVFATPSEETVEQVRLADLEDALRRVTPSGPAAATRPHAEP